MPSFGDPEGSPLSACLRTCLRTILTAKAKLSTSVDTSMVTEEPRVLFRRLDITASVGGTSRRMEMFRPEAPSMGERILRPVRPCVGARVGARVRARVHDMRASSKCIETA